MNGRRLLVLVPALLAVLSLPAEGASTPVIRSWVTASPNDLGWYRVPVLAAIWFEDGDAVVDCSGGAHATYPNGASISAIFFLPRVPASECRSVLAVADTRIEGAHLSASVGRWTRAASVEFRVDMDPPSRVTARATRRVGAPTADGPSVVTSPVALEGEVTDGFSGPRLVALEFVDSQGMQAPFTATASCAGCGRYRECRLGFRPPCGYAATWQFRGDVPAGRWTVTPIAWDLAGNQARGQSLDLIVVAVRGTLVASPSP
jgi:hypothetical protein